MQPTEKEKKAAKAFARLGDLKGGHARAEALTPEQRQEIAREAAAARWSKKKEDGMDNDVPRATHSGVINIGDVSIPCAVLEDGTRVLTQWGFL